MTINEQTVHDDELLVEVSESGPGDDEWLRVLDSFGCDEPSQTPGYFDAMRNLLRDTGNRAVVCVARRKGRICGMSIVIRGRTNVEFRIGERTLFSLPVRSMTVTGTRSLFADEAVGEAVARRLSGLGDDLLVVERYNPVEGFWQKLTDGRQLQNRPHTYLPYGSSDLCSLQIRGSWQDFQKSLPSKVRHELSRKQNRINQAFGESAVTLDRFETTDQTGRFFAAMQSVEGSSWQHRRGSGRFMNYPRSREYLDTLARHSLLRGYVLSVKDQPIAFAFGIKHQSHYHVKEIGFGNDYKSYSPGQVLLYRVLKDLFELRDVTECNLGYGKARFKKEVCDRFSPVAILWLPKKAPLMAGIIFLHCQWMKVHRLAGRALGWLGVRQAVLTQLRHA